MTKSASNPTPSGPVIRAMASTDCPQCQGFVSLSGQGRRGEQIQLRGACPNGHTVFFPYIVK